MAKSDSMASECCTARENAHYSTMSFLAHSLGVSAWGFAVCGRFLTQATRAWVMTLTPLHLFRLMAKKQTGCLCHNPRDGAAFSYVIASSQLLASTPGISPARRFIRITRLNVMCGLLKQLRFAHYTAPQTKRNYTHSPLHIRKTHHCIYWKRPAVYT